MKPILHGVLRVIAAFIITNILWWYGGVKFGVQEAGDQINNLFWYLISGVVWIILLGKPFIGWIGEFSGKFFWPSDSSFDLQPQYSIAEARVKEGRYDEAIETFRGYAIKYPKEITPHLRIADLYLEQFQDPDSAIHELKEAVRKARSPQGFSLASFRLADLYTNIKNDPKATMECLHEIQRRYPKTKHAEAALERANRLIALRSQQHH